jgi:hypothetical protein
MKKLWLVIGLLFFGLVPAKAQTVGPSNAILCNKVYISGALGNGTTQLVAGVTGQSISICGWDLEGTGTGTTQLILGTGASCTSPTNVTVNMTSTVSSFNSDHIPYAWITSTPGQSLCAVVASSPSALTTVYYSQF